jgi:hypothetical protein
MLARQFVHRANNSCGFIASPFKLTGSPFTYYLNTPPHLALFWADISAMLSASAAGFFSG